MYVCMYVHACVYVCVRACVRANVLACVRDEHYKSVRACVVHLLHPFFSTISLHSFM